MEAKKATDISERLAESHLAVAEAERRNEALVRLQEASVGLLSNGVRDLWTEAEQRLQPREMIDPHSQINDHEIRIA